MQMHNPPHPGSVLRDALAGIPMSVTDFARHLGISRVTLSRILHERAGVTPEVSIRLSEAFGQSSPDIWFKMQNDYDFWQASKGRRKRVRRLPAHIARPEATAA